MTEPKTDRESVERLAKAAFHGGYDNELTHDTLLALLKAKEEAEEEVSDHEEASFRLIKASNDLRSEFDKLHARATTAEAERGRLRAMLERIIRLGDAADGSIKHFTDWDAARKLLGLKAPWERGYTPMEIEE